MAFFSQDQLTSANETAQRSPARPQATLGEATEAAWRMQLDQRSSLSAGNAIFDEYEDYRSKVHKLTGVRLFNPYTPTFFEASEQRQESVFFRQVEKLREQSADNLEPDDEFPTRSPSEIRRKIANDRARQRAEAADIEERSRGFITNLGGFAGAAAAATIDPPVLVSLGLGMPFSSGILIGALVDAGVGIVSETVVQASVQSSRRAFGEEPSLKEALTTIAAVGGGSFALSAFLRGGAKGTKALVAKTKQLPDRFRTSDVRAAEDYLTNQHEVAASNPFPETAAGKQLHAESLDQAMDRLMQTTALDMVRASGREATTPLQFEVAETTVTRGEDVGAFGARVEATDPPLFARAKEVRDRLVAIAARIKAIDARLETPSVAGEADKVAKLQQQLAEATDKRKIKRLQRQIDEANKRAGGDATKKARADKSQRTKLANEKKKLRAEAKPLENEARRLSKRTGRAALRVTAETTKRRVFEIKQIVGDGEATSIKAGQAADFATVVSEAVSRGPAKRAVEPTQPAKKAGLLPEFEEEIVPAEGAVEDVFDLTDEQLQQEFDKFQRQTFEGPELTDAEDARFKDVLDELADREQAQGNVLDQIEAEAEATPGERAEAQAKLAERRARQGLPEGRKFTPQRVIEIMARNTEDALNFERVREEFDGAGNVFIEVKDFPVDRLRGVDDVDPAGAANEKGAIIVAADGTILDGRHRAAKAIQDGQTTINAIVGFHARSRPAKSTETPITPDARAAAVPETPAAQAVKDDTIEAQIRELIDQNPTARMEVVDADGNISQISAQDMLDDLADDQKLLNEIKGCIAGAIT